MTKKRSNLPAVTEEKRLKLLKLEKRVREMYLDGVDPRDIRTALNLSYGRYKTLFNRMIKRWEQQEELESGIALKKRIAQLDRLKTKADTGFDRSVCTEVVTETKVEMVECDRCEGSNKEEDGSECLKCKGTGKLREEITTQKAGSAGNPAFLKEARACVESAAKLEGLGAPQKIEHTVRGQVNHEYSVKDSNLYKDATPEQLAQILVIQDEIAEKKKKEKEGDIIDVQVIEKEEEDA